MGISFVVAIASCLTPEDHEDQEAKEYGDDCWRCGMAHFLFLVLKSRMRALCYIEIVEYPCVLALPRTKLRNQNLNSKTFHYSHSASIFQGSLRSTGRIGGLRCDSLRDGVEVTELNFSTLTLRIVAYTTLEAAHRSYCKDSGLRSTKKSGVPLRAHSHSERLLRSTAVWSFLTRQGNGHGESTLYEPRKQVDPRLLVRGKWSWWAAVEVAIIDACSLTYPIRQVTPKVKTTRPHDSLPYGDLISNFHGEKIATMNAFVYLRDRMNRAIRHKKHTWHVRWC
jgi:hypothetical protein